MVSTVLLAVLFGALGRLAAADEVQAVEDDELYTIDGFNQLPGIFSWDRYASHWCVVGDKVVGLPSHAPDIEIIDLTSRSRSQIPAGFVNAPYKFGPWHSVCHVVDGKVYALPNSARNIIAVDPQAGTWETFTDYDDARSRKYQESFLVGRTIYGIPSGQGVPVLAVDVDSQSWIELPGYSGNAWRKVVAVGSKLFLMPQRDENRVAIIDTAANVAREAAACEMLPSAGRFEAAAAVGGKIVALPYNEIGDASTAAAIVFDVDSEECSALPIDWESPVRYWWIRCAAAAGKAFCFPYDGRTVAVFDPASNSLRGLMGIFSHASIKARFTNPPAVVGNTIYTFGFGLVVALDAVQETVVEIANTERYVQDQCDAGRGMAQMHGRVYTSCRAAAQNWAGAVYYLELASNTLVHVGGFGDVWHAPGQVTTAGETIVWPPHYGEFAVVLKVSSAAASSTIVSSSTSTSTATVSSTTASSTISTSTLTVTSSTKTVSSSTSTSTATVTSSTLTSTFTSSTTTEPRLSCMLTSMVCPVPDHLPGSSYVILGNESSQEGPCAIQGGGQSWWFEIPFHACNVTQTRDGALQTHVVTLVPNVTHGDMMMHASALPAIVCRCEHPMLGSASVGVDSELVEPASINSTGTSNFSVELSVYPDDTFEAPITSEQAFPPEAARIYIEAQSANPGDVIGFLSCSASPTGEASDPHTHEFLQSSCPAGLLDWQGHSDDSSHVARASVLTFSFSGYPSIFITCTTTRCNEEPCGQCLSGSRRLGNNTRQLQSPISTRAQVSFQLQAGSAQVVLPSTLSAETLVSAWLPADLEEDAWLTAVQQIEAPIVVRGSFTLYGCGIKDAETFASAARIAIADWVGAPTEHVRIVRVYLVTSAGSARRLQAQADAVKVDFEILMATADSVDQLPSELTNMVQVDAGSSVLVIALQHELYVLDGGDLSSVYTVHSDFRVEPEPSALAFLSNTAEQPRSASMSMWIAVAAAIAAAILVITVLCFLRKKRVTTPKLSTEPAAQPHHGIEAEVHGVEGGQQAESNLAVNLSSRSGDGNSNVQDWPDPADGSDASESADGCDTRSI